MQGWREEQEDAHACHIHVNKEKLKSWSFFMVFDGHGGDKASQRASTSILRAILEQDYFVELLNCYIVTDYRQLIFKKCVHIFSNTKRASNFYHLW